MFPRMRSRRVLMLFVALSACDRAPAPPPYASVASVKQLMVSIIEPAADVYWDAVGSIDDSTGTTYLYPKTSEEWQAVENSALTVAEAGNLLMMPSRSRDDGEWMAFSRAMLEEGRKAAQAAQARDTVAVFNAGAALYESCTKCHQKYVIAKQ